MQGGSQGKQPQAQTYVPSTHIHTLHTYRACSLFPDHKAIDASTPGKLLGTSGGGQVIAGAGINGVAAHHLPRHLVKLL